MATPSETLALTLAASTEMPATRASPIIRALAVAAVRRGTRRAFCRASLPITPQHQDERPGDDPDDRPGDPGGPDQHAQDGHEGARPGQRPKARSPA